MTTGADVRRIALSMPEVEEKAHFDRARFRVRNKIFATLWPSKTRAVVKLSLADQSALVAMDPEIFSVNSWSHPGWTNVHLEHISKGHYGTSFEVHGATLHPRSWRPMRRALGSASRPLWRQSCRSKRVRSIVSRAVSSCTT